MKKSVILLIVTAIICLLINGLPVFAQAVAPHVEICNVCSGTLSHYIYTTGMITEKDSGQPYILCEIGEEQVRQIKEQDTVQITGIGFSGQYDGTITKIGDKAKVSTSSMGSVATVPVEISIREPKAECKTGFSARLKINTDTVENAVYVPFTALIAERNDQYAVYRIIEGYAVKTAIKTGLESEDGIQILSGLDPGDQIVRNPDVLTEDIELIATES